MRPGPPGVGWEPLGSSTRRPRSTTSVGAYGGQPDRVTGALVVGVRGLVPLVVESADLRDGTAVAPVTEVVPYIPHVTHILRAPCVS